MNAQAVDIIIEPFRSARPRLRFFPPLISRKNIMLQKKRCRRRESNLKKDTERVKPTRSPFFLCLLKLLSTSEWPVLGVVAFVWVAYFGSSSESPRTKETEIKKAKMKTMKKKSRLKRKNLVAKLRLFLMSSECLCFYFYKGLRISIPYIQHLLLYKW